MASIVNRISKGGGNLGSENCAASEQSANKTNFKQDDENTPGKPYILNTCFYLFIIGFIGAPMWFYTCSVTRYPLPDLNELENRLSNSNGSLPKLHIDVSVIQLSSNPRLTSYLREKLPREIGTNATNVTYNIAWRVRRPTDQEVDTIQLHLQHFTLNRVLDENLIELEANLLKIHKPSSRFRLYMYLIDDRDYGAFCDTKRPHSYTISFERFVYLCPSMILTSQDEHSSTVHLIQSVLEDIYSKSINPERIKLSRGAKLDLLFSLLPENGIGSMDILNEVSDKLHNIYDKNVRKRFPEFKEIVDMRTITQYVFDLLDENLLKEIVSEPSVTDKNSTEKEAKQFRTIKTSQIHKLINHFESRVSKHSSQNVHNVLFIVPNPEKFAIVHGSDNDNLNILEVQDVSTMMIFSDEKSLVLNLRALLRRVTGLSSPDLCENCLVRRDVFFNRWELDAIMGTLTMFKLQNTLLSLRSIKHQVVGVKIPKDVSHKASDAYRMALDAIERLEREDSLGSYRLASKSYEISEIAFYDPSLLESLYFPDEYKYAIYIPLFLPLALPFIMSLFRVFKAFTTFYTRGRETKLRIN